MPSIAGYRVPANEPASRACSALTDRGRREAERPELEARRDPDGDWAREWAEERETLEALLGARYLDGMVPTLETDSRSDLWTDRRRVAAHLRVDFPLDAADVEGSLADAAANVRFVDLRCELRLERWGVRIHRSSVLHTGGAWLDDEVAGWIAEVFTAAGFEPEATPWTPRRPE